jgi:hypothetical protein
VARLGDQQAAVHPDDPPRLAQDDLDQARILRGLDRPLARHR